MKFAIIDLEVIEQRIEELENTDTADWEGQLGQIKSLKYVLSNTITLEKELKNAYYAGKSNLVNAEEYIQNLKLKN